MQLRVAIWEYQPVKCDGKQGKYRGRHLNERFNFPCNTSPRYKISQQYNERINRRKRDKLAEGAVDVAKVPRPENLNVRIVENCWEFGRRNGPYLNHKQDAYKTIKNWYFRKRREGFDLIIDIYEMYLSLWKMSIWMFLNVRFYFSPPTTLNEGSFLPVNGWT